LTVEERLLPIFVV